MAWWFRRCCRLLMVAVVGSSLVVAPVAPAFAGKPKTNNGLVNKDEGPDNVGAYMIVVACLLVGMTTICRRSPRSAEKNAG